MPKANQECLVIYSAGTSRIRRIASSTDKSMEKLKADCPCHPGEACSVLPWTSMAGVQAAVEQVTGIPVGNDRYVAVDPSTGEVTQVLRCDPECGDLVQGHTLERHDKARVGWRQMINGSWQRSLEGIRDRIAIAEREKEHIAELSPEEGGITQEDLDSLVSSTNEKLVSLREELSAREAPR